MKITNFRKAIIFTLLIPPLSASATGFVNLPAVGKAITGGSTAFTLCNSTGDFGSNPAGSTPPTFTPGLGLNNTCAVPVNAPPIAGYVKTANTISNIVMKNAFTKNMPVTIGTLTDAVWRKGTSCVFAAKFRLNNVDYDKRANSPGSQYFEINDTLRAGFRVRGPVAIAYNFETRGTAQSDEVLYRSGLTYTSVVHKPGTTGLPKTSQAPISKNWVSFTSDINYFDPDGSSMRDSPWFFVKSTCTNANPVKLANALELRQLGQEGQPIITIKIPAYAPSGANVTR